MTHAAVDAPPRAPILRRPPGGSMRLATRLAPIDLLDVEGAPVRLGSLWAERPVVLVFVRHFG